MASTATEPTGTEAWTPLNNHPSVKPTSDIYDTVTKGKLAIGSGRLISSGDNAADANFPDGSTGYHWKSSEPIANYLVENSVGNFDSPKRKIERNLGCEGRSVVSKISVRRSARLPVCVALMRHSMSSRTSPAARRSRARRSKTWREFWRAIADPSL